MPYNPGGIFSLIASYFATPGATIRTEQHNPVFEDVASALSSVLLRDGRAPMTGPLNMNGFPINNVVAGSSPSSVATLAQAMPIGAVIDFAGAVAPSGWALCYGQAVSRSVYATLFALIGTTYGAGDGSTTFNLPDLRGCVVAATDNMGGVQAGRINVGTWAALANIIGSRVGAGVITLLKTQLPSDALNVFVSGGISVTSTRSDIALAPGTNGFNRDNTVTAWIPGGTGAITSTGTASLNGTTGGMGNNVAHDNIQPTVLMSKIIRISYDG